MLSFFIIILVILCIILMVVVLLQSAKGGGLSGTFGGSNVTSMFGSRRTSDFLSKTTVVLATVFLLSCLLLNLYITGDSGTPESMIQREGTPQHMPSPSLPPDGPMMQGDEQQQFQQEGGEQQQQSPPDENEGN